jgi:hypothetical protein
MSQPSCRTRTAETPMHSEQASAPEPHSPATQMSRAPLDGDPSSRTEIVSTSIIDEAAISFALERERALARSDHAASVRRLRRAVAIGICVWAGAGLLDLFVTQIGQEGSLEALLISRAIGTVVMFAVLLRLWRPPEPSPALLWLCDALAFTTVAACVSVNTLNYRGIDSPYAAGMLVVLLGRGSTTIAPWRRGAWLFGLPALAYPITLLTAAFFDPRIAAQFRHPPALGAFGAMMFMLFVSWAVLVLGGNYVWLLSREALEARNIGRYQLERRLGSGGMADVWAAYDRTLKQRVALKTVYGHRPGSSVVARFEREARALAGLTHPNTVRIFDYGVTEDGLWYYAMELLQGETLRQLVAREGPLQADRLVFIARQVLRALGEAHGKGIIHRDIKPENVFVAQLGGENDIVKLLDFGIAKAPARGDATLTMPGHVAGTPAYVAPEMILGHPGDARSDIYSFGGLLYYAASGRLPFVDADPAALFVAHLNEVLEPLAAVVPGRVPPALAAIIERCMAKDPGARFASTQALLEALQAFAADR